MRGATRGRRHERDPLLIVRNGGANTHARDASVDEEENEPQPLLP